MDCMCSLPGVVGASALIALLLAPLDASAAAVCMAGQYPSDAVCIPCTAVVECAAGALTCSGPNDSQCAACNAGFYRAEGPPAICIACSGACPADTFESAACSANADRVCSACHASCSACTGPGASECTACPAGHYLAGGQCVACAVCQPGTFQETACGATTNTACTACTPGTFAPNAGAAACTACGDCGDQLACTSDRCDAVNGCVHDPIATCEEDAGTSDAGQPLTDAGETDGSTDSGAPNAGDDAGPSTGSNDAGPYTWTDGGAPGFDAGSGFNFNFGSGASSPDDSCAVRGAGSSNGTSLSIAMVLGVLATALGRRRRCR